MSRDYDPATGRYIESDFLGLDGGINTYAYVDDGPLGASDPLGMVKRGGGWSNPAWAKIKQAEAAIRQEVGKSCSCHANASNDGCIPCDLVPSLLNRLDNSSVTEAPLIDPDTGKPDCGVGRPGYNVYLSAAAFTKTCDCLASTLYHELLHNVGLEHEATAAGPGIRSLEEKCMSHLCKGGSR
jgi:hypothetical protein